MLSYADKLKESDYFEKNYFTIADNSYIEALADLNSVIERLCAPHLTVPTDRG